MGSKNIFPNLYCNRPTYQEIFVFTKMAGIFGEIFKFTGGTVDCLQCEPCFLDIKRANQIPVADSFCKKCFPCKNQISQNCSRANCTNLNSTFRKIVFNLPNRTRDELDLEVENLMSSISCCTEDIFMTKENLEICDATCSMENQLSNCNFDNQYSYQSCNDCKETGSNCSECLQCGKCLSCRACHNQTCPIFAGCKSCDQCQRCMMTSQIKFQNDDVINGSELLNCQDCEICIDCM